MDWFDLTALELGAKIQAGEVSAVDAARACLARIEEKEPTVHAFVTVTPEAAYSTCAPNRTKDSSTSTSRTIPSMNSAFTGLTPPPPPVPAPEPPGPALLPGR